MSTIVLAAARLPADLRCSRNPGVRIFRSRQHPAARMVGALGLEPRTRRSRDRAEEVDTSKTKRTLPVNAGVYPIPAAALAEAKTKAKEAAEAAVPQRVPPAHVLIHEGTGLSYNAHTFRHEWRAVAKAAGLPSDIQFRDLRATTMTELSDSGADIISMSTHSGHKTPQMARRYARPTQDQFTNAAKQRLNNRKPES